MTTICCGRARIQSSVGEQHDLLRADEGLGRRSSFGSRQNHLHIRVDGPAGRRRQRFRDDVVEGGRSVRRTFFTGTALKGDQLLMLLLMMMMLLQRRMLSVSDNRDLSRLQGPLSWHDDDRLGSFERP